MCGFNMQKQALAYLCMAIISDKTNKSSKMKTEVVAPPGLEPGSKV